MTPQHIQTVAEVLRQPVMRRVPSYPPQSYNKGDCLTAARKHNFPTARVDSLERKYTVTRFSHLFQRDEQVVLWHRVMAEILNPQPEPALSA